MAPGTTDASVFCFGLLASCIVLIVLRIFLQKRSSYCAFNTRGCFCGIQAEGEDY